MMRNELPDLAQGKEARENSVRAMRKSATYTASERIRRILATTDLSKESLAGVNYGVTLAEKVGAAIALLHVVELPVPPPMPGMREVLSSAEESYITKRARARLAGVARSVSRDGTKVVPILRSGHPFYGIITTAQARRSDLIVIATHGYTGINRVFLGSTTERVLRHAPCSVLTIPRPQTRGHTGKSIRTELKRIVVPIDFSKTSQRALPWAASLAAKFDAELILLHVVEKFPLEHILGGELINEMMTPLMKQSEAGLKTMAQKLAKSGLKVSVVVRYGKPFNVINNESRKLGADLITLTTRGHTGWKQLWLGSTVERVVRNARCPVLVVRGRKAS